MGAPVKPAHITQDELIAYNDEQETTQEIAQGTRSRPLGVALVAAVWCIGIVCYMFLH